MRLFELSDGKSNKFWEVSLDGASLTVRFGRIGTAGQRQSKDHGTPAAARAELERLVREKTTKGYVEVEKAGAVRTFASAEPLEATPSPTREASRAPPHKPRPKQRRTATTKNVTVGTSVFRAPGKMTALPVDTISTPAFEIVNWPSGDTSSLGFGTRAAVANDGAVLKTSGLGPTAVLWNLTPEGLTSVTLNVEGAASGSTDAAIAGEPDPRRVFDAEFASDSANALLFSTDVQAFDRKGARLAHLPAGRWSMYRPCGFLADGRLLAGHHDPDGGGVNELVIDPLGEPSTFSGELKLVHASDVDETLDLILTTSSADTRAVNRSVLQLWSISRRTLVTSIVLSDFPGGISSVALVQVGSETRIVVVASSCLFVTDLEGSIHFAVQLERAGTIHKLPGARVAIDGVPPVIFDVAKNDWVGRLEIPGWDPKHLLIEGLRGTTRAVIFDQQRRLGLVDFATRRQWTPIEGPSPAATWGFAVSRNGRFVAASGCGTPLLLRIGAAD